MWTADKLVNGPSTDGGKVRIPALKTKDGDGSTRVVRDNAQKSMLLYQTFFPPPNSSTSTETDPEFPLPAFKFEEITDAQIHRAIIRLKPYKAPGPSGIPNAVSPTVMSSWSHTLAQSIGQRSSSALTQQNGKRPLP